jgi:hypothetical protein
MQKREHEIRVKFYDKYSGDVFDESSLPVQPEVQFNSVFD